MSETRAAYAGTGSGTQRSGAMQAAGVVLLAEDNAINGLLMQTLLEEAGFACDVVASGAQAITAVRNKSYDVVLMDIQLPDMDGVAVSSAIRALGGRFAQLPIVAVTGYALAEQRDRFQRAGISDYVAKPLDIDRFLGAVRRWAAEGRGQPVQAASMPEAATSTPLLDQTCLDELRATMPAARFQDLILAYVEGDERRITTMHTLLARSDLDGIRREAHDLKGTSGNFGARRLHVLAGRLEAGCRRRDTVAVSNVLSEIDAAASRTWAALRGKEILGQAG